MPHSVVEGKKKRESAGSLLFCSLGLANREYRQEQEGNYIQVTTMDPFLQQLLAYQQAAQKQKQGGSPSPYPFHGYEEDAYGDGYDRPEYSYGGRYPYPSMFTYGGHPVNVEERPAPARKSHPAPADFGRYGVYPTAPGRTFRPYPAEPHVADSSYFRVRTPGANHYYSTEADADAGAEEDDEAEEEDGEEEEEEAEDDGEEEEETEEDPIGKDESAGLTNPYAKYASNAPSFGDGVFYLNGAPARKSSNTYPRKVLYFTNPRTKPKPKAAPAYPEFIYGSDPAAALLGNSNKRQRYEATKTQPMYIMDRYGNLYPYKPAQSAKSEAKKEIDANDLIRMLLGGTPRYTGNAEEKQVSAGEKAKSNEELQSEAISKAINDEIAAEIAEEEEREKAETEKKSKAEQEKTVEETPLTREGLAEILSQLANEENQSTVPEAAAGGEKEESQIPSVSSFPIGTVPVASIPVQPPVKRKSTVPCLNVHKTDTEKADSEEKTASKPVVVNDVKVSAPQLKKKNLPFSPPLNVYEFKSKYVVVVSLPGVSKEFVDIDYHPTRNELVVKGETINKYLSDDDDLANSFILKVSEQRFGNFERVVKLPAYPGIDDTNIKAKFLNGMLEISLPKVDESKIPKTPKKIILEDVPDEELEKESSRSGLI